MRADWSRATIIRGGSSDTEVNELTVMPWRTSSYWVALTATPVAQYRIAARKSSCSLDIIDFSSSLGGIVTSFYLIIINNSTRDFCLCVCVKTETKCMQDLVNSPPVIHQAKIL